MRRINSEFKTGNLSEEGQQLANRDYFGYVEMDDFAFYAMADSLDGELVINSARIAVESLIRDFTEHPSMKKKALSRYQTENGLPIWRIIPENCSGRKKGCI